MFNRTVIPKPGIYYDIPFDEYRNWDCASVSILKLLDHSERYCYEVTIDGRQSEALRKGALLDTAILTPELYDKEFVLLPETYPSEDKKTKKVIQKPWNMNATYCKDFVAKINHSGKTIVKASDVESIKNVKKKIRMHPLAMDWLEGSKQVAMVWEDPETGILCKGLIDNLCDHYNMIVDLKSTTKASKDAFRKNMSDFKYHIQAAMYTSGHYILSYCEMPYNFGFVVVETANKNDVATYALREDSLRRGLVEMRSLLLRYKNMKQKYDDYIVQKHMTLEQNPGAKEIPLGLYYRACTDTVFNAPNENLRKSELIAKKLEFRRREMLKADKNLLIPPEISIYDGIREYETNMSPYEIAVDIKPYLLGDTSELAAIEFTR